MFTRNNLIYGLWSAVVILCASYVSIIVPSDIIFILTSEIYSISGYIITGVFLTLLLNYRSLPGNLRKRIVDFYTYRRKKRFGYDETLFLNAYMKIYKQKQLFI